VLYLIDFDAFFASAAGTNRVVTVTEGGTYGTEGYCPPDLAAAVSAGDFSVAPYSDRYGRDTLLLEFLLMSNSLPSDDPLVRWDRDQLQRQYTAWQARSDPKCVRALAHLDPATVFTLNELKRPTSVDLAIGLGLSLPERRVLRRVTELTRPTPAILGPRTAIADTGEGKLNVPTTQRKNIELALSRVCTDPKNRRRWSRSQISDPGSALYGRTRRSKHDNDIWQDFGKFLLVVLAIVSLGILIVLVGIAIDDFERQVEIDPNGGWNHPYRDSSR
jgi:hypothetical protein